MAKLKNRTEVQKYYDAATEDYLRYYQSSWHQHMHYGFDRDLPKGGNPTENLVRYMAEVAKIQAGERVLDAGCGVGGSTVWLRSTLKTENVALNFVEEQLRIARALSAKKGVEGIDFVCGDFHKCPFPDASFDVIWAVESPCHARDKALWAKEMFRMLKPGGRLIIADGFRCEEEIALEFKAEYECFLKGWAVPHLASLKNFARFFKEAGFADVYEEDITKDIYPHALAIFRFGLIFTPLRWIGYKLGMCSKEKLGNAQATYYQYTTLKKNLWKYGILCGTKAKD